MKRHLLTFALTLFVSFVLLQVESAVAQNQAQQNQGQQLQITNGPRVEGVGDTWAVIAWTTNTGGSSVVRYGTAPNAIAQTAEAPYSNNPNTQAQNHRVRITNLQPNTTYYFIVGSDQGEGTGTATQSSIAQFKTK